MASGEAASSPDGSLAHLPLVPLARIASHLSEDDVATLASTCRGLRANLATLRSHAQPSARVITIQAAKHGSDRTPTILLSRDGRYAIHVDQSGYEGAPGGTTITVYDLERNNMVRRIRVPVPTFYVNFVSGNARHFVVGTVARGYDVYGEPDWSLVNTVAVAPIFAGDDPLAVSVDATAFAWKRSSSVFVISRGGDDVLSQPPPGNDPFLYPHMTFNHASSQIAGVLRNDHGYGEARLCIWNTVTGDILWQMPCAMEKCGPLSLAYSTDDTLLLVNADDGVILVNTVTWESRVIYEDVVKDHYVHCALRGNYALLVHRHLGSSRDQRQEDIGSGVYRMDVVIIHIKTSKRHSVKDVVCQNAPWHVGRKHPARSIAIARDGGRVWLAGRSNEMIELRTGRLAKYLAE